MSKDTFIQWFALAKAIQATVDNNYESIYIPKPSRDKMIWYSADGPMRIHETPKLTKTEKKTIKKAKYKGE